jgi:hypothetical protein
MKNEKMKHSVEPLNGEIVESGGAEKYKVQPPPRRSGAMARRRGGSPESKVAVADQDAESECEIECDTLDPIRAPRNGKIAALSRNIRESLNRRMRRGEPGPSWCCLSTSTLNRPRSGIMWNYVERRPQRGGINSTYFHVIPPDSM